MKKEYRKNRLIDGKPICPKIRAQAKESVRKYMEKYKNIAHIVIVSK